MGWPALPFGRARGRPSGEGPSGERRGGGEAAPLRNLGSHGWALLDLLPAYVTVQDRDFRILHTNHAFRNHFGEDGAGRPCYAVYKGREAVCPECRMEGTLSSGRPASWEETLRTLQMETIHTVVHAAPIRDEDGRIVGVIKVSSDISECKHLQRQLELSQQEYKALFQNVPCYLSIQDRDFKIIKSNRLFERDFGRGVGKRCYEVYKGRDSVCEGCPVEKTFQDGTIHSSEETVRLTTKEAVDMIVYTAPISDLSGQTFAVMEMSTNIAEVKRLQRELASLGQAVAITAHTIKNILNGLQGGAYVVQSGLKRGDHDLARQGWEMVKEGVDLVGQFVKDILLISKARVPEYQETWPHDPAKQVWRLFEKRARDLGIDLVLQGEEGEFHSISLDPKGIHTVLSNLVANALDACLCAPERRDHRIRIGVKDLGDQGVLYEVEDNGAGVPEAIRDKLFREIVSTKESKGTGLGLVVTRKIITEHGGSITLETPPQGGTVFRVRLPRGSGTGGARQGGTPRDPAVLEASGK